MVIIFPKRMITYDGAQIDVFHANKGEGLPRHEHLYSHLIMCHAGSCVVRKQGKQLIINKDSEPVNLLADGWHEIEALEDNTVFCNIFSLDKR
jgi:quercetin dioxygenase-like cupin family protein